MPILGATMWTGFFILGMPDVPAPSWDSLSAEAIYEVAMPYILPFTLGACTLGLLGSMLAYPLGLLIISRHRKHHENTQDPARCSEKPA